MLWYFTCTRNRVPSAHMQSLYLSRPSSKYTSPAELGMREALNMTDPFRTMLFSCKEKIHNSSILTYSSALYSAVFMQEQNFGRVCGKWENRHSSTQSPISQTSNINRTCCYIPYLQPWARCLRPLWTLQSCPLCWRPRFHEWWPCCHL